MDDDMRPDYMALVDDLSDRLQGACKWLHQHSMSGLDVKTGYELDIKRQHFLLLEQVDALVTQFRYNPESAAGVNITARPVFESGLNLHWFCVGPTDEDALATAGEVRRRHLALLRRDATWADNVVKRLDLAGQNADRWRKLAGERSQRFRSAFDHYSQLDDIEEADIPKVPSVQQLLKLLGLSRLYWGYMVGSQWTHGTALGAMEFDILSNRPFSAGETWLLPYLNAAWALVWTIRAWVRLPNKAGLSSLNDESPIDSLFEGASILAEVGAAEERTYKNSDSA